MPVAEELPALPSNTVPPGFNFDELPGPSNYSDGEDPDLVYDLGKNFFIINLIKLLSSSNRSFNFLLQMVSLQSRYQQLGQGSPL